MRIICPWKDYYDGVQSIDMDSEPLYIRDKKDIQLDKILFPFLNHITYLGVSPKYGLKSYVIGFCGTVYPCIKLFSGAKNFYIYTLKQLTEFVKNNFSNKKFQDCIKKGYSPNNYWNYHYKQGSFIEYFVKFKEIENKYTNLFEKYNVPIFTAEHNVISLNNRLSNFEFYKVKSVETAYQEIRMYLSNLAAPQKEMPTISDEIMLEAKGFNKRTSFRKEKSKRKVY
jgi:hypothetical protein